jgi:hypothetical protein|nr:DUF6291 domain-containing protein [uncultured Oscillibacter sp.]
MAEGHKKSFMLYFDNYPSIAALPADQRGELLVLLYRYAMAAEEGSADPEEFADQFPDLTPETHMAYRFLAETIRRDTEKWVAKQRHYQSAAMRRMEESGRKPGPPDRDDISWMRPHIERLRASMEKTPLD